MAQRSDAPSRRGGKAQQATGGATRAAPGPPTARAPSASAAADGVVPVPVLNQVRLRGRWAGAVERELPSGDVLVSARLVVARDGPGVDTIDCAVWRPDLRRRALAVPDGTVMEVDGSLRRRFWRTPTGPASRYEVEVTALRRASGATSAPTHASP